MNPTPPAMSEQPTPKCTCDAVGLHPVWHEVGCPCYCIRPATQPPPQPAAEERASEREHLVETAGYWFANARKAQLSGKMADALLCMANAYNHVENALAAARDELATLRPSPVDAGEAFQPRVLPWLLTCFGEEIANDLVERNHRFLEESLELVQSTGCTASEAHQLVDYVFSRETGEREQECGGVMVTLAALCLAAKIDMHQCAETELVRIWTKVEKIRAKQAVKPKHSPLPLATAGVSDGEMRWRPISEMDRTKMQFVLLHQEGAQRAYLWNPRGYWETGTPIGHIVRPGDDCSEPTHWMELPESPSAMTAANQPEA